MSLSDEVTAFQIAVPEAELVDLRERLARTRWPDAETVDDWTQGAPLAYVQEVARYWAEEYDWRKTEARLAAYPQFRTEVDGLGVHFLHVRSPHADALPLVLTHGWPGSVIEFLDVLGPLTDPTAHGGDAADAFHVVCPSLPGYGFSDKPAAPGWSVERIAAAWVALMERLGYTRFGAQGGDWGAMVSLAVARSGGDRVAGVHVNMPMVPPDSDTFAELTPAEQAILNDLVYHRDWGTGYAKIQSTRPQTLGYALADSPSGQLAWILEKFREWTDCDGHPENALTRDQMLDNITLYWLTGTAASSARLYWESYKSPDFGVVDAPVGCSIFPREIARASRRWAEKRFTDLRYWNEPERGGHFAAFEQPELFVEEVRRFFRLVR